MLLFAATLALSAALMFILEPMFARMVLPLLGGTPAVWNTCMVFYQAVLLAGYAYAHAAPAWLGLRRHSVLHVVLLIAPLLFLPIGISRAAWPPGGSHPVPWLLLTLSVSIGFPMFVVCSTAPLLQRWFASSRQGDPYFLYAASNAGSMIGLLAYPILVEPVFGLGQQGWGWSAGYVLLMLLTIGCAAKLWKSPPLEETSTVKETAPPVTSAQRWQWLALSFVPSSLLLGVTTYISTDIASIPLLWVLPLSLYLLTFILVFSKKNPLPHKVSLKAHLFTVLPLATLFFLQLTTLAWILLPLHLLTFFFTSMVCHGELSRSRPPAGRLTEFYLWMSLGGVLGGLFNALLAPHLLASVFEYPLMLVLACLLRPSDPDRPTSPRDRLWDGVLPLGLAAGLLLVFSFLKYGPLNFGSAGGVILLSITGMICYSFSPRSLRFGLGVAGMILIGHLVSEQEADVLHAERSFFGIHRVKSSGPYRLLIHGTTIHGAQSTDSAARREPLMYYHRGGPLGSLFESLQGRPILSNIAVIGLGTGTTAAFAMEGQAWTFYEIDPAVERIARDSRFFTYVQDCRGKTEVVIGDGRLSIERARDRQFGLILVDAFSSDSIPIHLITREALRTYLSKLSDDGVIMFHISNRYFDLRSVLADLASDAGLIAVSQTGTDGEPTAFRPASRWVALARRKEILGTFAAHSRSVVLQSEPGRRVWTDDYSNLLSVLGVK